MQAGELRELKLAREEQERRRDIAATLIQSRRRGIVARQALRSRLIAEAKAKGVDVHFGRLMDLCHLKNSELEEKFQRYKGRVVFRGDDVKDQHGHFAFSPSRARPPLKWQQPSSSMP